MRIFQIINILISSKREREEVSQLLERVNYWLPWNPIIIKLAAPVSTYFQFALKSLVFDEFFFARPVESISTEPERHLFMCVCVCVDIRLIKPNRGNSFQLSIIALSLFLKWQILWTLHVCLCLCIPWSCPASLWELIVVWLLDKIGNETLYVAKV